MTKYVNRLNITLIKEMEFSQEITIKINVTVDKSYTNQLARQSLEIKSN